MTDEKAVIAKTQEAIREARNTMRQLTAQVAKVEQAIRGPERLLHRSLSGEEHLKLWALTFAIQWAVRNWEGELDAPVRAVGRGQPVRWPGGRGVLLPAVQQRRGGLRGLRRVHAGANGRQLPLTQRGRDLKGHSYIGSPVPSPRQS